MSTPLFQEALIEARKLREAAATEAKNAVLEAVSPMIKQMIDREISGVILEQDDALPLESDQVPPPAPAPPSPDAGTVAPVAPAAPPGAAPVDPLAPPMPGMAPAVAKAAPPIVAPEGTAVPGKFETDPTTGAPTIVLNINDLFMPAPVPADDGSAVPASDDGAPESLAVPPSPPPPPPPPGAGEAPGGPPAEMPGDEKEPVLPPETSVQEIYRAVTKLLEQQQQQQAQPPSSASPPIAPAPNAAAPVADPAAPVPPAAPGPPVPPPEAGGMTPEQMMAPALAPPVGASPPAQQPPAQQPPAPPAPAAVTAPPQPVPPPQQQQAALAEAFGRFKLSLGALETSLGDLASRGGAPRSSIVKEARQKEILSLYGALLAMKSKNAISSRVFALNEERLDMAHENLNRIYSYPRNPLKEESQIMKSSLREFARSLFEGAEGFEKQVGAVDPAGDSEGGSAEHAKATSGNPKGHKAEAEKAKFQTKEKSEWPGKPAPTSILEQLEEELAEMMGQLQAEGDDCVDEGIELSDAELKSAGIDEKDFEHFRKDGFDDLDKVADNVWHWGYKPDMFRKLKGMLKAKMLKAKGGEETMLELNDEEVMMEARKARARLKKLQEQAEEEEEEEESAGSGGEDADSDEGEDDEDEDDDLVITDDGAEDEDAEDEDDDDHLTLTINLDGVDSAEVQNVNVSLDGEAVDADGDDDDGSVADAVLGAHGAHGAEEDETPRSLAESKARKMAKAAGESAVLKKQLQETQLLTARSLYLNKLFVRDDLSGTQKRKIVSYLDSARTIAEAKEIYNRVTRVLNKGAAKKAATTVNESASRRAGSMLNEAAMEPSFDASRWQILAGVKKNAK